MRVTDIEHLEVSQKASIQAIFNIKPGDHVTSYFKDLKSMLFEYSTFKLLVNLFLEEFLSIIVTKK